MPCFQACFFQREKDPLHRRQYKLLLTVGDQFLVADLCIFFELLYLNRFSALADVREYLSYYMKIMG